MRPETADPTEADPRPEAVRASASVIEGDDAGTQAAGPRVLAEIAAESAKGSNAAVIEALIRPSGVGTHSGRSISSAVEALESADLPRMRVFHTFGVFAPLGALALSLSLGGNRLAQILFWIGAGVISVANMGLVWLARSKERWKPLPVGALWMIATTGTLPVLYYFGPFSAALMVQLLGIVIISLGRDRWTSVGVAWICICGHLALTVPMMLGWIDDVGVLTSAVAERSQLAIAECLAIAFMVSGYALGRWARHTNHQALSELAAAVRMIGDQQ